MAGESILSRPYLQNAELQVLPPRVVALAAGTWTLLVSPNPARFQFLMLPVDYSVVPVIAPVPYGVAVFLGGSPAVTPINIHSAVYPLLVAGMWWGFHSNATSVTIIETLRLHGGE